MWLLPSRKHPLVKSLMNCQLSSLCLNSYIGEITSLQSRLPLWSIIRDFRDARQAGNTQGLGHIEK